MKITEKAIVLGIIYFIIFLFGNVAIGNIVGIVIPGGDEFINSYFFPLYAGIITLTSIFISFMYVVIKKINQLLDEVKNNK